MRAVNLYYLSGISNERLFSDYENILSGRNGVTESPEKERPDGSFPV